jgi:small-conductance mechanosensitive channel
MIAPVPALPTAIFGLPEWAGRLALAGVVLVVTVILLWVIGWIVPRLVARSRASEGPRARQTQTAVSALATSLRYIVLIAAFLAITFALAGGGAAAALSGGALVAVVVGFASQRFLVDTIAGFFILFEDQYGVGDVVRLEPTGYTGEVHSLGLRTTVLRGPGGERMIIPNGAITAVRLMPGGLRRHRLEFLTRDPDAVAAALHEIASPLARAGGPWNSEPRVVRQEGDDGVTRVIAVVDVDVHREDAVAWLVGAVAGRVAEALECPPLQGIDPGRR